MTKICTPEGIFPGKIQDKEEPDNYTSSSLNSQGRQFRLICPSSTYDNVRVLSQIKVRALGIFRIARRMLKFMISNA